MYEEKMVKIKLSAFGLSPKKDFQSVVDEHEEQGWEFVQINPSGVIGHGIPAYFELLFKRKIVEAETSDRIS